MRKKPELLLAVYSLKDAAHSDNEELEKAFNLCRTASSDIHYAHALYREIAEIALSKKLWVTAEEFAIKTLKKKPSSGAALRILGKSLQGQDKLREASICHRYGFPTRLKDQYFNNSDYSSINSEQSESVNLLPAYAAQSTPLKAPVVLLDISEPELAQTSLESKPAYCLRLPESKLWFDGFNTVTWDQNGDVIVDASKGFPEVVHSALENHSPLKLADITCLLGNRNSNNYYHWMNDIIPRLHVLSKSGIDLNSIKRFIINPIEHDYQIETLNHFGIDRSRLCVIDDVSYYQCEDLLLPIYGSNTLGKHQATWTPQFLKTSFLKRTQTDHTQRIYISRKNANGRSIKNEEQLVKWLGTKGFRQVYLEGRTVSEQAQLFDTAEIVLGPHGAGLTNSVFCKPGTTIIELYKDHIAPCFWINSEISSLQHAILYCGEQRQDICVKTDEHYHDTAKRRRLSNFSVNIDSLEKLLAKLGIF